MPSTDRDPENENLKAGSPPDAATGSEGSDSAKTKTDPVSGESHGASQTQNKSAAGTEAPAAQKDSRVRPD
jgi:hypothetical protein